MPHRPDHPRPIARRPRRTVRTRAALTLPQASLASLLLAVVVVAASPGVMDRRAPAAQTAAYIDQIADLPLMRGLREVPEAGMTFDKPSGRIVEAFAHGDVSTAAVRRFYRQTLPQLGWTRLGTDAFAREGERLTLEYMGASGGDLTVRFTLSPR
jgi:hypothetical protein